MLARASELFVRCFSEPGTPLLASYSSTSWTRSAPGERVERLAAQMTQVLVWSTNCSQKWTEWRAEGESSSWVPPIGKDGVKVWVSKVPWSQVNPHSMYYQLDRIPSNCRVDIIDPAVLRPGRLQKILFVDLPSESGREDILKALTKNGTKPRMSADVDLRFVARHPKATSFSGTATYSSFSIYSFCRSMSIDCNSSVSLKVFLRG